MIDLKKLRPIHVDNLVRIGRPNDGGYVIPKTVFKLCDGLLSFGINKDWSFEKDFSNRNPKANIHCYDYSVNFFSLDISVFSPLTSFSFSSKCFFSDSNRPTSCWLCFNFSSCASFSLSAREIPSITLLVFFLIVFIQHLYF